MEWAKLNELPINIQKSFKLSIGKTKFESNYKLDEEHFLKNETAAKDLGLEYDSKLSFASFIKSKVNKSLQIVNYIKRSLGKLSKQEFKYIYGPIIRTNLGYFSSIWSPHFFKDIKLIEKVQRKATKLIAGMDDLAYEDRCKI